MKSPTFIKIDENYQEWIQSYQPNIDLGTQMIEFTNCGNQWDSAVVGGRKTDGKESMTFSLCLRAQKKIKSQFDQLQFSLNLFSNNQSDEEAQKESMAFKLLFNHFVLNDNMNRAFSDAWKKCVDFGYSFIEISYKRDNDYTLDLSPDVIAHEDPSIAFWDMRGSKTTKIDGNFCGLRFTVSDEELSLKMPDVKIKMKNKNDVIRYWFRRKEQVMYYLMQGGQYRREDLVDLNDPMEEGKIQRDSFGVKIVQYDYISCIYYMVLVNGIIVKKPIKYPTKDLPLVYHPGLTVWSKKNPNAQESCGEYKTSPYTYAMKDAQVIHNYAWSQAATILKGVTGRKYLFSAQHMQNELSKNYARNINKIDGGAVFGADKEGRTIPVQVVDPVELPSSLLQIIQLSKQEIDEIAGSFIDSEQTDTTIVSGVALDKITKNMSMPAINSNLIAAHKDFLDDSALLIQQMLPEICTTERSISINKEDNSQQEIIINKRLDTGKIINNIKSLRDNYNYRIQVSPTDEMQNETSIKAIATYYALPSTPDVMSTKDLFIEQLPIKKKDEFIRRIKAQMDQKLLAYSEGALGKDEYIKLVQEQQAQMQKMQQMQMQQELQANNVIAMAEKMKADAMQFNEETKRMKAMADTQNDNAKLEVDLTKYGGDAQLKRAQHILAVDQHNLDIQKEANAQFNAIQEQNQAMQAQQQQGVAGNDGAAT